MVIYTQSNTILGATVSPSRLFFTLMLVGSLSVQVSNRIVKPGYYEGSNFDDDTYIDDLNENFRQMGSLLDSYDPVNGDFERQRESGPNDVIEKKSIQARQGFDPYVQNDIMNEFYESLGQKLPGSFEEFKDKLPKLLNSMEKKLPDIFKGVEKELKDKLPEIFEDTKKELPQIYDNMLRKLPGIFGDMEKTLPGYSEKIKRELSEFSGGNKDEFSDIIGGISNTLPKLSEEIKKKLEAITERREKLGEEISKNKPTLTGDNVMSYPSLATFDLDSLPKDSENTDFKKNLAAALPRVDLYPLSVHVLGAKIPPYLDAKKVPDLNVAQKAFIESIVMEICFTEIKEKGETRFCKTPGYEGGEYNLKSGFYICEISAKNPLDDEDFLIWGAYPFAVPSNPKTDLKFESADDDEDDKTYVKFETEYDISPYVCHVVYVDKDFNNEVYKSTDGVILQCKTAGGCSCSGGTYSIENKKSENKFLLIEDDGHVLPRKIDKYANPAALGVAGIIGIVIGFLILIAVVIISVYLVKRRN